MTVCPLGQSWGQVVFWASRGQFWELGLATASGVLSAPAPVGRTARVWAIWLGVGVRTGSEGDAKRDQFGEKSVLGPGGGRNLVSKLTRAPH